MTSSTPPRPAVARGLCAYAFKQTYDAHRGLLVYLRLYAGSLQPHSSVYNASRNTRSHCQGMCTGFEGSV